MRQAGWVAEVQGSARVRFVGFRCLRGADDELS